MARLEFAHADMNRASSGWKRRPDGRYPAALGARVHEGGVAAVFAEVNGETVSKYPIPIR